jgi:male-specific lethal 2
LQCYKKLCEYLTSTGIYKCLILAVSSSKISNGIPCLGASCLTELIKEGAGFKDEFKSNSGLSRSAYSILPCVYTTNTTSTQTGNTNPISVPDPLTTQEMPPIKTVSNGSSIYSVMYAGSGNKITIKRKAAATDEVEGMIQPEVEVSRSQLSPLQQTSVGIVKCIPASQLTYTQCQSKKASKSNKVIFYLLT